MVARVLAHPILRFLLLAVWLFAQGSLNPGVILLGILIAWLISLAVRRFWPESPTDIDVLLAAKFIGIFVYDVVVANLEVAWLVLTHPADSIESTFIEIPLDLQHPFAITVLANTISLTPGTVSSNLSGDRKTLLVHCLHCPDPTGMVAQIKNRYETRLQEIFE